MLARTVFAQTLRQHVRPRPISAARALHSTASLANSNSNSSSSSSTHPFSFLPANALEPKAKRTRGLTEIRGPYYAPVTKTYLDELLKDWGEYVDGVKFAGGAFSLMPEDRLRALIETAHKHGKQDSRLITLETCSCCPRLLREHRRIHRACPLCIRWRQVRGIQVPDNVQELGVRYHLSFATNSI